MNYPPKSLMFQHGFDVALILEDNYLCLKPAVSTLGERQQSTLKWPLQNISRFGTSFESFYFEVFEEIHSKVSQFIYSIKCENPKLSLKKVLKYCKEQAKLKKGNSTPYKESKILQNISDF